VRHAFLLALVALAAPAEAQTRYLTGADDVPLPQGFAERGADVAFAGEGGRLLEARASGPGAAEAVRAFYAAALPPLGWSQAPSLAAGDALSFRRGRERLTIEIAPAGANLDLAFRLAATPAQFDAD